MMTLNDGRSELWQWDTGRKLTVDTDCAQVHFSNKVFGRSIDVDVAGGVAIIPDILLQTDKELNVWAFVGTAENGYTKIGKTFKVNRRNKPADYVFTPPEQTSLEEILEKIDYLESIQDPDAIKNAVEDYLKQNPVQSPVQSVNGYIGEVKLTAEDVGAISEDDLQEATNEALAKAKASGEFDGKDGIDGYTPIKGVDYFDGKDGQPGANGKDGQDYVLTEADKQEIAEQAAELVEVPEGGSGVTDEQIASAVEDYMAENPVSADVGDGSVSRKKLADDLAFAASNSTVEAPNQYGYGWYYDHTRRTAANILGEMYRTKIANERADADTINLLQDGDSMQHNVCICEDTSRGKIYAVYAVSTDKVDNASSKNCYVRLTVISNPYVKASRTLEHYKVSGNGQYGNLNIITGTSDANIYVDANGVVHIWFNASDESGVQKIASCTFDPTTGTFADYDWCTLTVGENEPTQLTGDALTSIADPSITYQKNASLQMNGKYVVFDGYIYAGNCCSEATRNGIILRSLTTDCKNWEFVCCPAWKHESHGKCELSISDGNTYGGGSMFIALRQVYQKGASVSERASAPMLVASVNKNFEITGEWLVPDCASRPWFIGTNMLIHNPESRNTANVVAVGASTWPISFEKIGYANYLCGFIQNNGRGNNLVLAGTQTIDNVMQIAISFLSKADLLISSYSSQKTSEAAAMEYFKSIGGVSNKALTFTGAVSATYDGTKAVTVNIPQASAGGGSAEWVKLGEVTTAEELTEVEIAFTARKFNRVMVLAELKSTATNTENKMLCMNVGGVNLRALNAGAIGATDNNLARVVIEVTPAGAFVQGSHSKFMSSGSGVTTLYECWAMNWTSTSEISSIKFMAGTAYGYSGGTFGVGTKFIVMAQ